jgi:predicted dehydrogenase
MANKIYTVAILGIGGRGGDTYGSLMADMPEKWDIVALCDLKPDRLEAFAERFGVAKENLFTDEKEFFEKRRADVLVIATPDADHVRHATYAFNLGYDVMMEKPITDKKEEMDALLALQQEKGCKALVCHVLRYAPAFVKTAELIESGVIGRLVAIQALERVAYWHQAHSYVRGN